MNLNVKTILIVEDDELNRTLLKRRLDDEGYNISVCENGLDAINLATEQKFDLILLDLKLPDISGLQVLIDIKNNPDLEKTHIIMVTANDERETVLQCIEKGATDYLIKPFAMPVVKARVQRCLNNLYENKDKPPGTNILLVDDQELSRDVLAHRLKKNGYKIKCVSNGAEAFAVLANNHFDLILLDILMPDISGVDILKSIRSEGHHKETPVIMVTALDDMETVNQCMHFGADDYILKPLNTELLKIRISSCLQ